jgi:hypothetical protein
MPHVDGMSLLGGGPSRGESPFAGPVAAVTRVVTTAVAQWKSRKAADVRELEIHYARASDAHDLERMEHDWDRREGGGVRSWD